MYQNYFVAMTLQSLTKLILNEHKCFIERDSILHLTHLIELLQEQKATCACFRIPTNVFFHFNEVPSPFNSKSLNWGLCQLPCNFGCLIIQDKSI